MLMLLPPVVALVCLVGRPWHPTDDLAIVDLRVRDVLSWHTPLTGLYSRPGWNHPGPLMFWMIRAVSVVAGGAPWGTRVGVTVFQVVALGWLAWITSKHGLRMLLAAATVTSLTYLGISSDVFRQPWNLWLPLPFFLVFIFLVCLVATGSFRQLIGMSIVGTVIIQTHVGYAPLILAGFAWAIGCAVFDFRRGHVAPVRWRSTVVISGAIWGLSWIPPLVGVVVNAPGNLGLLIRYFASGGHQSVGFDRAAGIMAVEYRIVPPWLGGHDTALPFTAYARSAPLYWLLVPCVLLALGGLAAKRSGSRRDARMVGFAALLFVVGIVAIARADEPRGYTFEWRVAIAAFVVVASLWSIGTAIRANPPSRQRVVAVGAILTVVTWGCVVRAASETTASPAGLARRDKTLVQVMSQLRQRGLPKREVVLVRSYGTGVASLLDGVVDALSRTGVDVRVDPDRARLFGSQRVGSAASADEVWYVTEQGSLIPALLHIPSAHVIASTHPISPIEEAELAGVQHALLQQDPRLPVDSELIAFLATGMPHAEQQEVLLDARLDAEVNRDGGCRCAIVAVSGLSRLTTPTRLPVIPT
jgi:hypothetical protein